MKPSIGRIVIFQLPDRSSIDVCPAIITRVWSDTCVNLRLLPDCDLTGPVSAMPQGNTPTSVLFSEGGGGRTWHWPPRVD
jgi:hypothetical protein